MHEASGTGDQAVLDVLIPTAGRGTELAVTLAGLAAQDLPPGRIIVSDQTEGGEASFAAPAARALLAVLASQGHETRLLRHLPRCGLAEHREFLLSQASAQYVLYLDDDVWLEPGTVARMLDAIRSLGCGFVGSAPQGLSYLADRRPQEHTAFELVDTAAPERVRCGTPAHERWPLHNAANLTHLAAGLELRDDEWRAYRVAWVGACVLYDRARLVECGGFDFWSLLPSAHVGEDVIAQWRVMERHGGAGTVPSGAVHLESETTILDRRFDAPDLVLH